jgi:multidrug efflux pump
MIRVPSISSPFISRPVGTTLLTFAVALAGGLAYFLLPVGPLPQVDSPTISVNASLPGASPDTMASAVATPLERQFGRIASVTEMTSTSTLGSCSITLQFDLSRNIDAAARDVQAAINAARGNLPSNLPGNPSYQKVNPADQPIVMLALTSDIYDKGHMYDAASSIIQQKLSQLKGVGQVNVGGGALPAVRIEVNPQRLSALGLTLEDVRVALAAANANIPKGQISDSNYTWTIGTTDQLLKAEQYRPLIVAYRNSAPVRVSDVAQVLDSVEDIRTGGLANGKPAVLVIISRQPGANIIETTDSILAVLPQLRAEIPAGMTLTVMNDRTTTIRSSVHEVQFTMTISIILVILVVFAFLRDWRTTLIPAVAVPVSLIGTFGVMYLCGYSVDNLSLMALTIATGFVVDDAIVVIENITRHLEEGMKPMQATLLGAREIGFTVVSMSTSLIAVFLPILMMGGQVGRLFREFAVVLSVAIAISLVVSLTTTPMMCARLLKDRRHERHGWIYKASEWIFDTVLGLYRRTLTVTLRHPLFMILLTAATCALSITLYTVLPSGLFPQQDTGRLNGQIVADQDISFQAMNRLVTQYSNAVMKDPDVAGVLVFTGGGRGGSAVNTARMFVNLNDIGKRTLPIDQVLAHIRREVASVPGATMIPRAVQDLNVGGRMSNAQYQYTLQGDNLNDLLDWAPKLVRKLQTLPRLADVSSDQQNRGLQSVVQIDRPTAARMDITPANIDNTLYDAFGQRQVSTMFTQLNQYHVVMEAAPRYWQNPTGLNDIYIHNTSGNVAPLSSIAAYKQSTTFLSVSHQGLFPAVTLSFNLPVGVSLSDAVQDIQKAQDEINLPASIHGSFQGTALAYQDATSNLPLLIAAALLTVYIVLGMLYESFIHPITILSTLPSAGVGAFIALLFCHLQLDVISFIGVLLLIGIVKKNGIMMVDFALELERTKNVAPQDAIFEACLMRFRPIMMTTMAALLGALPLALRGGTGSELRRPLGIAIVGGLVFSQMLTLYTTPVVYLYLDRFRLWCRRIWKHTEDKETLNTQHSTLNAQL